MRKIIALTFLLPFLVACPISNNRSSKDANELYTNNMDFKKWKKINFSSISFILPKKFEEANNSSYTLHKSSSVQMSIPSLFLFFSIEEFNESDATNLQYVNNQKSNLHAVQKNYMNSVQGSLNDNFGDGYRTSELKKIKRNCISQVIIQNYIPQNKWDSDNTSTYFIVTKKVKKSYYVIQLIGRTENMRYLHDDFLKIVYSIK